MSKDTITVAEARALAATTRGAKYGNTRGVYVAELDRRFDSQHEAEVAVGLRRREQAGEIRDLRFQVPFDLRVGGVHVCRYVADYSWTEPRTLAPWATGNPADDPRVLWDVVEVGDAKGFRTPVYRIKARLMLACLGITIVEL